MKSNKYISLAVIASLVLAVPAFAQMSTNTPRSSEARDDREGMMNWGKMMGMRSGVIGTVTAINGNTLTVIANKVGWGKDGKDEKTPKTTPTPITYTVDASKATVIKAGVASTVADITVGDMVMIQGTVTSTNIMATAIRDGVNKKDKENDDQDQKPEPILLIQGNGQPIIAGTITAITGTTLTITNKSNVTYTVNASTAKVQNKGALSTLSTVVVGDNVIVQGSVNGTAVTAYSVIDQGATPNPSPSVKPNDKKEGARRNFFSGLGRFFQHFFGF